MSTKNVDQFLIKTQKRITSLWRRSNAALRDGVKKFPTQRALFLFVIVYVLAQVGINFPNFSLKNPIRDDDAYGYLLKAAQMGSGCFLQDCPALNDLRPQFTKPVEDLEVAEYRNRVYHRLFVVYHPLHSAAIVGMHAAGVDYETAYDVWLAISKVAMPLAVAYFIYTLWGPATAALALVLLAPTLYGGSGIHIIKMHTVVLILAFVLWANIYKSRTTAGVQLIVLSTIMGLAHPLGKLLALASLVLYLSVANWPLRRDQLRDGIITGLIVVLLFLAPSVVGSPELDFDPVSFYPGDWNYLSALGEGAEVVWGEIAGWANGFGGLIALLPVAALGLWKHPAPKKMFFMSGMMAAIFISGVIYVVPWYGHISFARVWPLVAIFLTAAFCSGLLLMAETVLNGVRLQPSARNRKGQNWLIALPGLLVILLLFGLGNYLVTNIANYLQVRAANPNFGDFINREQLGLLDQPNMNQSNSTILYMDELALQYYTSFGSLDHGAIFYSALRFTPDLEAWLEQREGEIGFLVNRNPLMQMPHDMDGMLLLQDGASLRIDFAEGAAENAAVFLGPREKQISIKVVYGASQEAKRWVIEAGDAGWFFLPEEVLGSRSIILRSISGQSVSVGGFRIDEDAQTMWPWDRGLAVTYTAGDLKIVVDLRGSLLAEPLNLDVALLDDRGLFVLGKVTQ